MTVFNYSRGLPSPVEVVDSIFPDCTTGDEWWGGQRTVGYRHDPECECFGWTEGVRVVAPAGSLAGSRG